MIVYDVCRLIRERVPDAAQGDRKCRNMYRRMIVSCYDLVSPTIFYCSCVGVPTLVVNSILFQDTCTYMLNISVLYMHA